MRTSRDGLLTALILLAAGLLGAAGVLYFGPGILHPGRDQKPPLDIAREPVAPPARPRTVALTEIVGEPVEPARPASPGRDAAISAQVPESPPADAAPADAAPTDAAPTDAAPALPAAPVEAAAEPPPAAGEATPTPADVTAAIAKPPPAPASKRGLVILQIGDSHTSADFLTGELRRRLQARYGRGAPGYITAGHPHIGVRSSSLNITASSGWTYKSLQRPDAEPAEFWLSGYNAVASAAGETLTFASGEPQTFDMIEIEVVRQPQGGSIDVKLDGVVQTSHSLKSTKIQPVVIRLVPTQGATEKVREIAITTSGPGQVMIASVAIYNRLTGLTYNSVGYVGAQASLLNKFSTKLFTNDLLRIRPDVVVLAFGTNEASNQGLDLMQYGKGYERIIAKIRAALPDAAIVMILPPDFSEHASGSKSDCPWHTPAKLGQIREVQREIAQRERIPYWNWASIMPSECGAHRWFTATPPLMAKDHVHFTTEGYKKSAEQFLTTLIPVIEKVRVGENAVPNN